MTQGKLPVRGWVPAGVRIRRLSLFEGCLERSKLRSHLLTSVMLDAARERIKSAIERYWEKHKGTSPVTATARSTRLRGLAVAARRLAAAPENMKWRRRLEFKIAPLFLEDVGAADFANHVLVEFERTLGRAKGLPRFLLTLRSRARLDEEDVGRCLALAKVDAAWSELDCGAFLPGSRDSQEPDPQDPNLPVSRDPYLMALVEELEDVWTGLTGRGVLAKHPVEKSVYFAEWLALVVRKSTRGKVRPLPGTILDITRALKSRKLRPV